MSKVVEKFLKDYKKPSFKIKSVDLTFELDESRVVVSSVMEFEKTDSQTSDLVLDAVHLELKELFLNDLKLQPNRFIIDEESLTILNVPHDFSLKIKNIIYPQNNTELEGLYISNNMFCTQNEPEGFRSITPYLDRPDVMSVFTTTIIADKKRYPVLLSNGNKIKCYDSFDDKHATTWHDPYPKPSYLFALVAGDLGRITDSYTTASGKFVELNIYCDLGNESKCHHAMQSLKKAMLWDEKEYGREYDLDVYNIVAVDSFNMGAMENKGLNIFNSAYVLADPTTATDKDYMGIESVIAHEYFHNWTGNRITCRDWFQLTLKEGLTVFRDQCFSADMHSYGVARIEDVKTLRERQFVEDASPTAHPIQPKSYISMNNFYTATVYEKGAEVIRMIYTMLGKKRFRDAMDLYFEKFDAMAVTTEDFLSAMEQGGKIDLSGFREWYNQSGTPRVKIQESFDGGDYILKIIQKTHHLTFPLKVALFSGDGSEILDEMIIVKEKSEEFVFKNIPSDAVLSINRDFSAPVIIENQKENFSFLMKYDTDSFNRYEASFEFAKSSIDKIISKDFIDKSYIEAYGYLLDLEMDNMYKALLLELPSVAHIIQDEKEVDFDLVCDARDRLEKELALQYKEKLLKLYKRYDLSSIANRAIKNRVLGMLASLEDEDIFELAKEQYEKAKTMTESIFALKAMRDNNLERSKEFMDDFYNRFKTDMLVMVKYLSLVASTNDERVLELVKEYMQNEVYDQKVPNLVRALIGSFSKNYRYFHNKDGSGYRFMADQIIEIDKINPQIASSLLGGFKIYNKINKTNKNMMQKELKKIQLTENLSKNSTEIVNKILTS